MEKDQVITNWALVVGGKDGSSSEVDEGTDDRYLSDEEEEKNSPTNRRHCSSSMDGVLIFYGKKHKGRSGMIANWLETKKNPLKDQPGPFRIALGHQARVGKDTFADYITKSSPFPTTRVSFAEGVYGVAGVVQTFLGKPIEKDPGLLQMIGTELRNHYGENIWVDRALKKISDIPSYHNVIVTDMRFENEMVALKENGFTTVKITRKDRPIDRNPNHISETALAQAKFDHSIENDGDMEQYFRKIQTLCDFMYFTE